MAPHFALLKVIALCGGVFGGLLFVIGMMVMINFCRNRCLKTQKIDDIGTKTNSLTKDEKSRSNQEVPISDPKIALNGAMRRNLSDQNSSPFDSGRNSIDDGAALIEDRELSMEERLIAQEYLDLLELEGGEEQVELLLTCPTSPVMARAFCGAENRRAMFRRDRQQKKTQSLGDSRYSSRKSGSCDMDAIAESVEEFEIFRAADQNNASILREIDKKDAENRRSDKETSQQAAYHSNRREIMAPRTASYTQGHQTAASRQLVGRAFTVTQKKLYLPTVIRSNSFEYARSCDLLNGKSEESSSRRFSRGLLPLQPNSHSHSYTQNSRNLGDSPFSHNTNKPLHKSLYQTRSDRLQSKQSNINSASSNSAEITVKIQDESSYNNNTKRDNYRTRSRRRTSESTSVNLGDYVDGKLMSQYGHAANLLKANNLFDLKASGKNYRQVSTNCEISMQVDAAGDGAGAGDCCATEMPQDALDGGGHQLFEATNVIVNENRLSLPGEKLSVGANGGVFPKSHRDASRLLSAPNRKSVELTPAIGNEFIRRVKSGYKSFEYKTPTAARDVGDCEVPTRASTPELLLRADIADKSTSNSTFTRQYQIPRLNYTKAAPDYRFRLQSTATSSDRSSRSNSTRMYSIESEHDSVLLDDDCIDAAHSGEGPCFPEVEIQRVAGARSASFLRHVEVTRANSSHDGGTGMQRAHNLGAHLFAPHSAISTPRYLSVSDSSHHISPNSSLMSDGRALGLAHSVAGIYDHSAAQLPSGRDYRQLHVRGFGSGFGSGAGAGTSGFVQSSHAKQFEGKPSRRLPNPIALRAMSQRLARSERPSITSAQSSIDTSHASVQSLRYF